MSLSDERLAELIGNMPQWIARGWVDDDMLLALRELQQARDRLANMAAWQTAVMSGYEVFTAMKPTTLTASDVSNVLDAVARVARAQSAEQPR